MRAFFGAFQVRFPLTFIVLGFVLSPQANASKYSSNDLAPFSTDGCSKVPNGDLENCDKWLHCCVQHDVAYFAGGTVEERLSADRALMGCIFEASESLKIASIYYYGVRMGGSPFKNTSYRWGYGWPYGRGYEAVSVEERAWVDERIRNFDCRKALIELGADAASIDRTCGRAPRARKIGN